MDDGSPAGYLLAVFLMIIGGGLFAGTETALASVNRIRMMSYADDGTPMTARSTYAEEQFSAMMTARVEQSELTLNDDVAAIRLTDYLRDAE